VPVLIGPRLTTRSALRRLTYAALSSASVLPSPLACFR